MAREDKLEIAILGTLPPIRALSSYCMELALALAKLTQVNFISFRKIYPGFLYPGGKLEEDKSFPEIDSSTLNISRKLTWYNPFSWLKAGLVTRGDLLHAQWWSVPLLPIYLIILGLFRLRGKPVVITIHNVVSHERSHLFSLLSGLLYRLGNHYIVHSEQNQAQLSENHGINQSRISIIPHGPLELFTTTQIKRKDARRELRFSEEHKVILLFGAIRHYKGIDTAIKAAGLLKERLPEIRLVIAGTPWEEWSHYQNLIDQAGLSDQVISHLEYIPTARVALYFQAADLVLLPYHHFDSQSGIGSAALAFEKPLIVSDTGGLPELVKDSKWVFPAGDYEALATAIAQCFSDSRYLQQMSKDSGQIRMGSSWLMIAEQTMTVYKRLLD